MLNHSCSFAINITWLDALTFEFVARLNSLTCIFRFFAHTCVHALGWSVTFLLVPVRYLLSRLWQPVEMAWAGHSLFISSGRVCRVGAISPWSVGWSTAVRPSGPAVFSVECFLAYGFNCLNSQRMVDVFCFGVAFDKVYFLRNLVILSKLSGFWYNTVFNVLLQC